MIMGGLAVLGGAALALRFGGGHLAGSGLRSPGAAQASETFAVASAPLASDCSNPSRELSSVPPGSPVGSQVGQFALDFTLPDLQGKPVTLSLLRGCVVILEFWASWCGPCRTTLPKVLDLAKKYQAKGLKVIGVSLDARAEDAKRFLEENGFNFTTLWGSFWDARQVAEKYGVRAIPMTFLIDRQGIIRYVGHPAYLTEDLLAPWL